MSMIPKMTLTPEHVAKVQECLDLLEEAQNTIDRAGRALCSVPGFANEWGDLEKPYAAVKMAWYAVAARRDKLGWVSTSGRVAQPTSSQKEVSRD